MENKKALNVALAYLTAKARTEFEVRRHLAKREISTDTIDETIVRLKEYGYIDDGDYARQYAQDKSGKLSSRLIRAKLIQRGIEAAVLEQMCISDENDLLAALTYANKALRSIKEDDAQKQRQKLTARLLYRGFDYEIANKVWSLLSEN